jgi:hypothetical protein
MALNARMYRSLIFFTVFREFMDVYLTPTVLFYE